MGLKEQIESSAVAQWTEEAKTVAARLENGSGHVDSCPAHVDIAAGVRLCLRLLICVLAESASPRRQAAWNGGAAFVAVAVVELLRAIFTAHGVDHEPFDAARQAFSAIGTNPS